MLPAVWPGDILSVCSHDFLEALPGDIVLFGREGRLVAHRVVERTIHQGVPYWITRGDTLDHHDPQVSSHELLGRITSIQRGHRRIVPRLTFWGQIASWILRRSEFCTRLLLRLRGWGLGSGGFSLGLFGRDCGRIRGGEGRGRISHVCHSIFAFCHSIF
jgi:hypothetical protein